MLLSISGFFYQTVPLTPQFLMQSRISRSFRCIALSLPLLTFIGCQEKGHSAAWWVDERERISLTQQLDLQEFRYDQMAGDEFQTLENLRQRNAEMGLVVEALRSSRDTLVSEVAALENGREDFRAAVLQERRQQAQKAEFLSLEVADGRTFADVRVTGIDDAGVAIRHADGAARLRMVDLSPDQRMFFGLDQELAMVAISREMESVAAYEREVDTHLAALDAERARQSAIAKREEVALQARQTAIRAQLVAAANARQLAKSDRSSSRSSRHYSSSTYWDGYSRPGYRYYYQSNSRSVPYAVSRQAAVERHGEEVRRKIQSIK